MDKIEYVAAGERAEGLRCGDVLLVEGVGFVSSVVRLVDGSRFSHAMPWTGSELADAQARGVVRSPIERYDDVSYVVVRTQMSEEDRGQIAAFLESVLEARWRYGWATFVFCGVSVLTGYRISVGLSETAICSGLCSSALVRAGRIFQVHPLSMTPRMLAEDLGVPA